MLGIAKELAKKVAHALLGEYAPYYIYASPPLAAASLPPAAPSGRRIRLIDRAAIDASTVQLVRDQGFYLGPEALAYASYVDGEIAALCIYWYGERYRTRNFWPLRDGEAKLVQIVTLPGRRGGGIATELITVSCQDVLARGFTQAYARIWHSNTPSLRAFERAGWARRALVVELNPLRRKQPLRIKLRAGA